MKPLIIENFADNGEFSHYELINPETGETLWTKEDWFLHCWLYDNDEEYKKAWEEAVNRLLVSE